MANTFDKLDDAAIALENGITELERDYGCPNDAQQFQDQINHALTDLRTARRKLKEATI